ncbi:4a-hydroxytetrahydrobiopterin dehydratase [Longimonas halophila]|uniref:Putative pterin-4-alpha-carbinolamine dehydratase n=1 Tax=Longimonas halophila TaxID=1469170 RepID=A0A2H3P307_9BACT|nr:4a-hydroxytetrahydrobiopterin dehydratase [Longimonas halophila]PEN05653.1 4a-hydroxytetrahydrobiopterin dehydratase [Longimonas halophila]
MADRTPLSRADIDAALDDMEGWVFEDDTITKAYTCADFQEAVAFIVRIGFHAEELAHHPELFNVYNSVDITLTTHDAGDTVTELDLELARRIDAVAPEA